MRATWIKRGLLFALMVAIAAGLTNALLPQPIAVDTAAVTRGPLEVTIDEEGRTRIREVYTVSAPVAGKVLRSPLEVGDSVTKDETVTAIIRPTAPAFHDVRTRRELQAAVAAAEAAVAVADVEVIRRQSELQFAESELARARLLGERNAIPQRTLEKTELDVQLARAALQQARANRELRKRELESARARLVGPEDLPNADDSECCIAVRAPASGKVLKLMHESEQVVQAGEPLLEIGDPHDLEIVVDLLSADAVRIARGAAARIENWGGDHDLHAVVERIDPAGFTKVSALGIEEQRVNVILRITDPPERWRQLGHEFRVYVRITAWRSENVLRVPIGALFRSGDRWAVFVFDDGRARLTPIELGHRNSEMAQVLSGLAAGERVILHPSDRIVDGSSVVERPAATTEPRSNSVVGGRAAE